MNCKNNQNVSKILDQLLTKIAEDNFAGWDPYDGLNSYFVHFPVLKRSKWYKIAVTQFFRRCPFNFRSLAGIERAVNPKSLGLVLLADSALAGELLDDAHRDKVFRLLEKKAINENGSIGWGYPFDWQSRTFFLPKNTPTVVVTSFIGTGILQQAHFSTLPEWFSGERYLDGIAQFIRSLNRHEDSRGICLSYSPRDSSRIYNASLLGAAYLSDYNAFKNEKSDEELIKAITSLALSAQSSSGAWSYGEDSDQGWVDHFHTGFVLDSLRRIQRTYPSQQIEDGIQKGENYYIDNFFKNGKIPRMYPEKTYPVDIHSCAQALITLAQIYEEANNANYKERVENLIKNVLNWTVENMWHPDQHYFYHRKYSYFTNKINYLRWNQAWMVYGLAMFLKANNKGN